MLDSSLEFAFVDPVKHVEDALESSHKSEIVHHCTDEFDAAKVTLTMVSILANLLSMIKPVLLVIYL